MPLGSRLECAAVRAFLGLPPPLLRRIVGPPVHSPDGIELDLQAQGLLWLIRAIGGRHSNDGHIVAARRRFQREAELLAPRSGPVRVHDREVPGASGALRARIYTPVPVAPRPTPGMVWFHGGGYVLGSVQSHDRVCRALASQAGVVIASIDYRLAPEHPFPAGIDDAVAAARWILDRGDEIGVERQAVAVGGDSAGGALAAVVAQVLRGSARSPIFQLLVYPATDATCSEPSHRDLGEGFLLTEDVIAWYLRQYLLSADLATDPRASPLLALDLAGLPKALVLTADFDPLRDEGQRYARRMREAGTDVETLAARGSLHGFFNLAGALREPARVFALAAAGLRRGLSR